LNSKGLTRLFVLAVITAISFSFMLFVAGCDDDNEGPTGGNGTTSSWSIVNFELEGNHFQGAFFLDEDEGWAIGLGGFLHYTSNGGNTWTRLPSFTSEDLWDVQFFDSDTGWIVGNSGKILRTDDGGITWRDDIYDVTNNNVYGLQFINVRKGIASGSNSTVLFSLDGGRKWDTSKVMGTADLYDIDYSEGSAVAVGEDGTIALGVNYDNIVERLATDSIDVDTIFGYDTSIVVNTIPDPPETTTVVDTNIANIDYQLDTILYTIDTVWSMWDTVSSGTTEHLNSVVLVNANNGWAVGDNGIILVTADGGSSWAPQTSNVTSDLLQVTFENSTTGWVTGRSGTILSTSDGGNTWTAMTSGTNYDLFDIVQVESNKYFAFGSLALLESNNGGTSWDPVPTNIVAIPSFMDLTFVNDNLGFAVGNAGAIIRTEDGGDTWNYRRRNQENKVSEWFTRVQFIDENVGWCVGETGVVPYNGIIVKTTDGGDTWEPRIFDADLPPIAAGIDDFIFIDSSTGWIVAAEAIYKTTDGGFVWDKQFPLTANFLNSISFVDSANGWVVGMAGTVLRTVNGGDEWENLTDTLLNTNLFDAHFVTDSIGWVVGANGTIWKTIDAAENWAVQTSGTTNDLGNIYFLNNTTGWVVGFHGTILYTTNGGTTWTNQPSPNNLNLTGVASKSASEVWISGENGQILKTLTGGN